MTEQHEPARSGLAAEIIARNASDGSDPLLADYAICRKQRIEMSRTITEQAQRIADLERSVVNHRGVLDACNALNEDLMRRVAQPVVVVMDRNPDFSDQVAVYVDGKRIDAKVMTYHSEEDCGDILARYVRVYRNEYGTPEDWELELPNVWKADEWDAIVASEDTYLPNVTVMAEAGAQQEQEQDKS